MRFVLVNEGAALGASPYQSVIDIKYVRLVVEVLAMLNMTWLS